MTTRPLQRYFFLLIAFPCIFCKSIAKPVRRTVFWKIWWSTKPVRVCSPAKQPGKPNSVLGNIF